jgi:small subunit ribosomal protein S18
MVRRKLGRNRKNRCRFCTKEGCPRPAFVDYKDIPTLKKLCNNQGKMMSRKRSGNCAAFQRAVKDVHGDVALHRRVTGIAPEEGQRKCSLGWLSVPNSAILR